jgi:hypothetical protein
MQSDGNAVVYGSGRALWFTRSSGNPGARMVMQGDGNLVVYSTAGRALWQSGVPRTAATPPPPPPSSPPTNPGNSRNCGDFATWRAAQDWFNRYYPYYGDVAQLDADGDRIACETLPGAP